MRKWLAPAAAALVAMSVVALAQTSTVFFTNKGDVAFPFVPPATGSKAGPGTITNMNFGTASSPIPNGTFNAIVGGDSSLGITGQAATTATGTGGAVAIAGGAGGATSGAGGAVTITAGGATSANGANVTITAAAGAGGTNAGGSINLEPGAAVSTGTPGTVQVNANACLITATLSRGTATANDQVFFIATRPLYVTAISEVHSVAAGGTSTLQVTKDTATEAPGTGADLLDTPFDLNGTANTVQAGALVATVATRTLAAGDRLAVDFANAIQSSAGVVVTACMAPI